MNKQGFYFRKEIEDDNYKGEGLDTRPASEAQLEKMKRDGLDVAGNFISVTQARLIITDWENQDAFLEFFPKAQEWVKFMLAWKVIERDQSDSEWAKLKRNLMKWAEDNQYGFREQNREFSGKPPSYNYRNAIKKIAKGFLDKEKEDKAWKEFKAGKRSGDDSNTVVVILLLAVAAIVGALMYLASVGK